MILSRIGRLAALALVMALVLMGMSTQAAVAAPASITSAAVWNDTSGNRIEAHSGGMIKVGSTYYWVGQDMTATGITAFAAGVYTPPFRNIKCYSSTNLRDWTFVSNVLTLQSSGDLGPNRVVERPKIIFNSTTNKYVLWVHIDDPTYSEAKVGVASSSSVCSGYTYNGSFRPLGQESRDMTVYKDTDGAAYLVHSSSGNSVRRVVQLTSDYLGVSQQVAQLGAGEAPAVFKAGSTYYMLSSSATGWASNDNFYATATSMAGPWTERGDFTPNSTNTYDSQTTYVLTVSGSSGTTYMYMGDRYDTSSTTSFGNSRYIWQPLTVSGTSVSMSYYDNWSIDTATGTWSAGTGSACSPVIGATYAIYNRNSGKALNVRGSSTADAAVIEQYTYGGWTSQKWKFATAAAGYYTIQNINSGKLMDIYGASTADGANNIQYFANSGLNQQWSLIDAGGGYCKIQNRNSGKLMDIYGASTADGANNIQYYDNGGLNQQWSITSA